MLAEHCVVIGIQDDGWAGLGDAAREALRAAGQVIGAQRTLELVRPHLAPACTCRALDGALAQVPGWIEAAAADACTSVVLASGDPLCHGIARLLFARLGREHVRVMPAPSALQLAFARWKKPWHGVRIASVHGPDAGEWQLGATPAHGLYGLMQAVTQASQVVAFTSPANDPARIARALQTAGLDDGTRMSVACRLGLPDETIHDELTVAELAARDFAAPNMLLIERPADTRAVFGFADHSYQQRTPEKGLITKLEVRALSLAQLGLRQDSVVWDIGAGSGSVGLEAARIARDGHVWAIEKNAADVDIAYQNLRRLQVCNYTLLHGKAPEGLDAWPDPDAVFVGGSGGELGALMTLAMQRLRPRGRLVINLVTLENLATATQALAAMAYPWEVVQLAAARSQPILDMHRLAAQNPVWSLCCHKEVA